MMSGGLCPPSPGAGQGSCQQQCISVARAARSAGDRDSSSASGRAARQGLIRMVLQEGAPCPAECAADEELKGIPGAEAVSD